MFKWRTKKMTKRADSLAKAVKTSNLKWKVAKTRLKKVKNKPSEKS
jgi:hypothetical protein